MSKVKTTTQKSKLCNATGFAFCVVVFGFVFFALSLHIVRAAEYTLTAPLETIGVGQEFTVTMFVNSEGETINAVEGALTLPPSLEPRSVNSGNSLISLWAEQPTIEGQTVSFGGITPGGWQGSEGLLFSVRVRALDVDTLSLGVTELRTLLHDGEATETTSNVVPLVLVIDPNIPPMVLEEEPVDQEPPEAFTPLVVQEPTLFNGDYALVFQTQDKGSGVVRYEVYESKAPQEYIPDEAWHIATSPHRLTDQSHSSYIYVRATDGAGNSRVAIVEPDERAPRDVPYVPIALLVVVLIGIFVWRILVSRK